MKTARDRDSIHLHVSISRLLIEIEEIVVAASDASNVDVNAAPKSLVSLEKRRLSPVSTVSLISGRTARSVYDDYPAPSIIAVKTTRGHAPPPPCHPSIRATYARAGNVLLVTDCPAITAILQRYHARARARRNDGA